MAIDTTLFGADIPAGTYAVGDVVELSVIDGPANVRSGRGTAILKNVLVGQFANAAPFWRIHIKNSDWIDDMSSITSSMFSSTSFDPESGSNQAGHDCPLTPNSSWSVWAECIYGGTIASGSADSICALVDIDYPQVSNVQNPRLAQGTPTSITDDQNTVPVQAYGAMVGSTWSGKSVDYFKAGYRYVLDAVEAISSTNFIGFVAFSNAAGMGGLQRIIPISNVVQSVRYPVKYASVLQKGPMEIKYKLFGAGAGTAALYTIHDYIKRAGA